MRVKKNTQWSDYKSPLYICIQTKCRCNTRNNMQKKFLFLVFFYLKSPWKEEGCATHWDICAGWAKGGDFFSLSLFWSKATTQRKQNVLTFYDKLRLNSIANDRIERVKEFSKSEEPFFQPFDLIKKQQQQPQSPSLKKIYRTSCFLFSSKDKSRCRNEYAMGKLQKMDDWKQSNESTHTHTRKCLSGKSLCHCWWHVPDDLHMTQEEENSVQMKRKQI